MMIIRRGMDYPELRDSLRGKRVAIWTCNTCARLCNGIGGSESAERLASKLRNDGVSAMCVISIPASCIMPKVAEKTDDAVLGMCDVILALSCDVGADCMARCTGKEVSNPIETLGPGYLDGNRMPLLADGRVVLMGCSPFVE